MIWKWKKTTVHDLSKEIEQLWRRLDEPALAPIPQSVTEMAKVGIKEIASIKQVLRSFERRLCALENNKKEPMKVITPGHKYELENFENKDATGQLLQFIEKVPVEEGSTELKTVNDGTTNEEVIAVLVDRMNSLQAKFPCRENAIAITHLETALLWLEKRTKDRVARGVEGKQVK